MSRFEFRLDYSDGTYAIESVTASSIDEAAALLPAGVESTSLLCIISQSPIEPLVIIR